MYLTTQVIERRSSSSTSIRIAYSSDDLANCYRLVYKTYLDCGYTDLSPQKMRTNLWNLLPGTYTLFAEKDGHPTGTLTCVMDSEAGLPSDHCSGGELQALRASDRRLCELSGLAINRKHADATTILGLFRYALALTTRFLNASDFIITVHPRHAPFYKDVVLFEELKRKQQCAQVNGAPGVLLRLDLETMRERYAEKYSGRRAGRDLHALYFVNDQPQLDQAIRGGLRQRQDRLDQQALIKLLFADTQASNGEGALGAIRMQWAAWNRAQADMTQLYSQV